jgi:hypothetical protein
MGALANTGMEATGAFGNSGIGTGIATPPQYGQTPLGPINQGTPDTFIGTGEPHNFNDSLTQMAQLDVQPQSSPMEPQVQVPQAPATTAGDWIGRTAPPQSVLDAQPLAQQGVRPQGSMLPTSTSTPTPAEYGHTPFAVNQGTGGPINPVSGTGSTVNTRDALTRLLMGLR